jgi:hypothetical protein
LEDRHAETDDQSLHHADVKLAAFPHSGKTYDVRNHERSIAYKTMSDGEPNKWFPDRVRVCEPSSELF